MCAMSEGQLLQRWKVGYAADPAIELLLDKSKLAEIKMRQLDMAIREIEAQLDILRVEKEMLQHEYQIK